MPKIVITDNPDKNSNDALLVNNISFQEFWDKHICPNTNYQEMEFRNEIKGIITEEVLYIKEPFMVEDVIKLVCHFEKGEEDYDIIANSGYGQTSSMVRRLIVGKNGIWAVSPSNITDITIKPLSQFEIDYPNFNRKNYEALMNAVDEFYKNL